MRTTNVVLYAISDGARRPLVSLHVEGSRPRTVNKQTVPAQENQLANRALASAKIIHAMSVELQRCDRQGLPHSDFVLVSETRESNEGGQQTSARFIELDPATLAPKVEGDKGASELEELFKEAA